jgi:hypothetical protein
VVGHRPSLCWKTIACLGWIVESGDVIVLSRHWNRVIVLVVLASSLINSVCGDSRAASSDSAGPYSIPVLVIHFFPTNGPNIDIARTGDWRESLAATRQKTERQTAE